MLILFLVTVSVLVVAFTGLAVFSFIAGLLSPRQPDSDALDDQPPAGRQPVPHNIGSSAPARNLARGVVANLVAYGALLLVFAGLILLFRAFGL